MKSKTYKLQADLWLYPGQAAWHFVTLSKEVSDEIKETFGHLKRGWGSLPVTVQIGKTKWETSIFPDKKAGAYLLPIKTGVRKKEKIEAGDPIGLSLEVRV